MITFTYDGLEALQGVTQTGLRILYSISPELAQFVNRDIDSIVIQKSDVTHISHTGFSNGINSLLAAQLFYKDNASKNRYFINKSFFEKEKV